MLISIIIPIYNTAPYLKRLCDSLKAQNLDDVELVFIDDCSTDNSAIELDNCLRELNHSHVQLLKNATNLGSGETRNKGIRAANGDYVIFIDSDDYISENHIARLRPLAEEKKYDIIIFDIVELRQQKKIYKDCTPSKNRDENIANFEHNDVLKYLMDNSGLNTRQRYIIYSYLIAGKSLKEIGNLLGRTDENIRQNLNKAEEKMNKEYTKISSDEYLNRQLNLASERMRKILDENENI